MKTLKGLCRSIVPIVVLLLVGTGAMAQAPPPNPPSEGVPLDVLAAILLAVGIGYGIMKIRNKKKSVAVEES